MTNEHVWQECDGRQGKFAVRAEPRHRPVCPARRPDKPPIDSLNQKESEAGGGDFLPSAQISVVVFNANREDAVTRHTVCNNASIEY